MNNQQTGGNEGNNRPPVNSNRGMPPNGSGNNPAAPRGASPQRRPAASPAPDATRVQPALSGGNGGSRGANGVAADGATRMVPKKRPPAGGGGRPPGGGRPSGGKRPQGKIRPSTVLVTVLLNFVKAIVVALCLVVMLVSVVLVQGVSFVVAETQNDEDMLDLENIKLNQTSYIMALNGDNPNAKEENDWVEYQELIGPENRIWVPLDEIPDNLVNAVVATEDRAFFEHHGVNIERTAYALANELLQLEDGTFGASTIEQQLVKNITGESVVVTKDGDRTAGYERKMREIFRAWGLDNRYSKDMIMEAYLNTMSLSERIAGVQAGAHEYFNKEVKDLTLAECALIAGVTRAPTYYSPYQNPENALERRDDVLTFMKQTGAITEKEYRAALEEPLGVTKRTTKENSEESRVIFNYFSDTVFNAVVEDLVEQTGRSPDDAVEYMYTGGLRIYSTVEDKVQDTLEDIYLDGYAEGGYFFDPYLFPGYQAALTVYKEENGKISELLPQSAAAVVNYSGELVGVIGGIGEKDKSLSLNRAVGTVKYDSAGNPYVEGTVRQVGSTMKPIGAYALGIDSGTITYSTGVVDTGVREKTPGTGNFDWPKNAYQDTYRNYAIPICSAIAESTNTVAARVGEWVGVEDMYDFLTETLQVSSLIEPNDLDLAPLVLGSMTYGMSAYELAGAYTIFGGEDTYGVFNSLHCYSKVEDAKGNIILEPEMSTVQAIDPQSGYVMNRLLSNTLRGGTMPGNANATANGMYTTALSDDGQMFDSVAKTGTTSDDNDRWFVGLTPYYVTAVWWGYDEEETLLNRWGPGAANNIPGNVWRTLMNTVMEGKSYKNFPDMPEGVQELYFCQTSGDLAASGCPAMLGYYTSEHVPEYCQGHVTARPATAADGEAAEGDDAPAADAPPADDG